MTATFPIQPSTRFGGKCAPMKRPKEFACFSYDDDHNFHLGDSSLKYYYPPVELPIDLSKGFESFVKHDETIDEHLDSLLKTIESHERKTGKRIDAHVVTWRGMMTKIMNAPYEDRDGFEMNATLYQDCIFIEENHEYRLACERDRTPWNGPIPQEVMSFWGYKFETLCTMPDHLGAISREFIEGRDEHTVNNKQQYCSVVRTGIGETTLCLAGEVDCTTGFNPLVPGDHIHWVELKTTSELYTERDKDNFERKLLKYWIQSFLLGVPNIYVGFRSKNGMLLRIEELETMKLQSMLSRRGRVHWDGNLCINFANAFLEFLRQTITDEGVWRIRRRPRSPHIEVFRVEEVGHGNIITDDFMNWRIKLSLNPPAEVEEQDS